MCKLCDLRGKTWNGDDPKCAFNDKGMLKKDFRDNWKCATLSILRSISYDKDRVIFSEDENASVLDHEGNFIFLKWYKSRGKTDFINIINENIDSDILVKRTDEELCLEIAYANTKDNLLSKMYSVKDISKVDKTLFYDLISVLLYDVIYNKPNKVNEAINFINLMNKIRLNSMYGIMSVIIKDNGGSDG